jgi:hypothetical protein
VAPPFMRLNLEGLPSVDNPHCVGRTGLLKALQDCTCMHAMDCTCSCCVEYGICGNHAIVFLKLPDAASDQDGGCCFLGCNDGTAQH